MSDYQRILAIVELDQDDTQVLKRATQLSRWSGAPLLVLHVLDYQPGFECDQAPVLTRQQVETSLQEAARAKIGATLARLGVAPAHVLVLRGKPQEVAPATAREWQADLIVFSKSARYGLDHARPAFGRACAYTGELLSVRAERVGLGVRLRAWLQPLLQSRTQP